MGTKLPTRPFADASYRLDPSSAADAAELASEHRIRAAKHALSEDLAELERHLDGLTSSLKAKLDVTRHLENIWVRVGLAFAAGFFLGRNDLLRPLMKTGATAAAAATVKQLVARSLA